MADIDRIWMSRALELAARGRGHVEPNPLVGAVVVRDGQIVGEGWHEQFGKSHAEVNALAAAGDAAGGATLYVTLEPCCHQGKTPPCTDAIVRAGIKRVVAAMVDPFGQVAGRGVDQLQTQGVEVDVGVCVGEAMQLNAPYLTRLQKGRPYVHAKWAMSLDGKIATNTGDSKWISGPASRALVHHLRGQVDAILVGAGTVRKDDPLLIARPPGPRVATRIVLSSSGTLPVGCKLLQTIGDAPVLVATFTGNGAALRNAGCDVVELRAWRERPSVRELLNELGRRQMTNVLVEGGAEVLGSFCDERLVDEFHVFVAPLLLGGQASPSPISGAGADAMSQAWPLSQWSHQTVGSDLYLHGWGPPPRPPIHLE